MQFLYVLYVDHFTNLAEQETLLASDDAVVVLADLPREATTRQAWPYSYQEAIGDMVYGAEVATYDAIVLGNNLGVGTMYAQLVADEMRIRTIVVFNNEPTDEERATYRAWGITRLIKRADLRQALATF